MSFVRHATWKRQRLANWRDLYAARSHFLAIASSPSGIYKTGRRRKILVYLYRHAAPGAWLANSIGCVSLTSMAGRVNIARKHFNRQN
jgi:hypothetical protein